jgi:CARDB protein
MNISKVYFLCVVILAAGFITACGTPSNPDPSTPDLVIVGRDTSGVFDCSHDGDKIRIQVLNFGSDASDSNVHVEFSNGNSSTGVDYPMGTILAGHTFAVSPDPTVPLSCLSGTCSITVHVDSNGTVMEGNEDNNIARCVLVNPGSTS